MEAVEAVEAVEEEAVVEEEGGNGEGGEGEGEEDEEGEKNVAGTEWMENVRFSKGFSGSYKAGADAFEGVAAELGHDLSSLVYLRPWVSLVNVLKQVIELVKMKPGGDSPVLAHFTTIESLLALGPDAWPVALVSAISEVYAAAHDGKPLEVLGAPWGPDHPDLGWLVDAGKDGKDGGCGCKRKNDEITFTVPKRNGFYVLNIRPKLLRDIRNAANESLKARTNAEPGLTRDQIMTNIGLVLLLRSVHSALSVSDDVYNTFFTPITLAGTEAELVGHGGRAMHVDTPALTDALTAAGLPMASLATYWESPPKEENAPGSSSDPAGEDGEAAAEEEVEEESEAMSIAETASRIAGDNPGVDLGSGKTLAQAVEALISGEEVEGFSPSSVSVLALPVLAGNYGKRMDRMRWRTYKAFGTDPDTVLPASLDAEIVDQVVATRAAFRSKFLPEE